MGKRKDYESVLKVLSEGSRKSEEFLAVLESELPYNAEWRVPRDDTVWTNLAESGGWKLQQNKIIKNVRIIDNKSVRRAFSLDPRQLLGVMDDLVRELRGHEENIASSSVNDSRINELSILGYLSQLRDQGAITDKEYEEKKKEILKKI